MTTAEEKRARIIAAQAEREAAKPAPKPSNRKPRSNWAASSGPGRPRRPGPAPAKTNNGE